jgi:hypothetical protein
LWSTFDGSADQDSDPHLIWNTLTIATLDQRQSSGAAASRGMMRTAGTSSPFISPRTHLQRVRAAFSTGLVRALTTT